MARIQPVASRPILYNQGANSAKTKPDKTASSIDGVASIFILDDGQIWEIYGISN